MTTHDQQYFGHVDECIRTADGVTVKVDMTIEGPGEEAERVHERVRVFLAGLREEKL